MKKLLKNKTIIWTAKIAAYLISIGFLIPTLLSAPSTFSVVLGIMVVVITAHYIYKDLKTLIGEYF